MTTVSVYSYTHSVTYVTDNIMRSLKEIILQSGLDPTKFVQNWETHERGIRTWIESGHLERVTLEIYDPNDNALLIGWYLDICYEWSADNGNFWTDIELLRYHILKARIPASLAKYDLLLKTKPGAPDVLGWGSGSYRSTDGMVKQGLGSMVDHNGLGANAGYWRR